MVFVPIANVHSPRIFNDNKSYQQKSQINCSCIICRTKWSISASWLTIFCAWRTIYVFECTAQKLGLASHSYLKLLGKIKNLQSNLRFFIPHANSNANIVSGMNNVKWKWIVCVGLSSVWNRDVSAGWWKAGLIRQIQPTRILIPSTVWTEADELT